VDEAQLVNDGARGVLLQSVVDRILRISPDAQVLFSSPQTENLEIFGKLFDRPNVERIPEREPSVAQNLIFIETEEIFRRRIEVTARAGDTLHQLGGLHLDEEIAGHEQSLAYIGWLFGRREKSLIYAWNQALCERVAERLMALLRERGSVVKSAARPDLDDLAAFVADHVHPRYALVDSIRYGVAFHYGNMPSLVRRTVEEYFEEGKIPYLICTSTLLHGINLPAKNLFLYDPAKGDEASTTDGVPVSSTEFWNLAGRAGRLGKEFEGNIFIIEPRAWREKQYEGGADQIITPALSTTVTTKYEDLLNFMGQEDHPSGAMPAIESAFVRLFNDARAGRIEQSLAKILGPHQMDLKLQLIEMLRGIEARVDVPTWITERNPGISVFRQHDLLQYMRKRAGKKGVDGLLPLHPLAERDLVYRSIVRLFSRLHRYFERRKQASTSKYFAQLALRWMRGESLRDMIDNAYERRKQKAGGADPRYSPVIRQVMRQVEQDLRFRYVKYTHCYNDLLRHLLTERGEDERAQEIPTLPLYLEVGASSKTMVSLIGLGISRMTAGLVADQADVKHMGRVEAERWLRENWTKLNLPKVSERELARVITA
jgi:hypothetical protein